MHKTMLHTDFSQDPLENDGRIEEYFGQQYNVVKKFAHMLHEYGEERGLLGPKEFSRIWERHILNSAALLPFIDDGSTVVDIGSGAGLPGIVLAAAQPQTTVILLEPMERRVVWLGEVVETLKLENTRIFHGRAEDYDGAIEADYVTARAVAPLKKLIPLAKPLVRSGGKIVALKGRTVEQEIDAARKVLKKEKILSFSTSHSAVIDGIEETNVFIAEC